MPPVTVDSAALEAAIAEIRPHLHGDVELVSVEGGLVSVRLSGKCADCTMQEQTVRIGIEAVLRARVPGVVEVVAVKDVA